MNRCEWTDEDGCQCEGRASRKYCGTHRAAAAARRQADYRDRKARRKLEPGSDAPEYIPLNNTRDFMKLMDGERELGEARSGRTVPRPKDVHPRPSRRYDEPEVVDYTRGGNPKPGLYERPRASTAPTAIRQDSVQRAAWQAAEQRRTARADDDQGSLSNWAALAELGEQEWLRDQARQQAGRQTEPHQYEFYFETPWRRGGYVDPTLPDMVDGDALGFRR